MSGDGSNLSGLSSDLQFCPRCGSVLPPPTIDSDLIPCARCPYRRDVNDDDSVIEEFVLHYNTPKEKLKDSRLEETESLVGLDTAEESQGPTVERQCPRCNHDIMTYTTRQTRSADEGQTVFYTCIKCKFQDIEYS
ncbi:DNA-directed RNA polymerase I subunit RPA12 [Aplysia californica]|uniref:DNA-directed RNA polymerase subunit n=1 Tax=Aplysia californica TaxID=6500 RepID=A0ABM0JQE6_APLCA|nr:DNA-directed RNA polymerase I subunit RPA12 [Aplysia californica]XP_005099111.1 DNA-directed RNA polymerase I subunit RPA12 [Aplysia californica]